MEYISVGKQTLQNLDKLNAKGIFKFVSNDYVCRALNALRKLRQTTSLTHDLS